MLAEATNITISFPNWFYATFSIGIIALIFLAGAQWRNVREVCKQFPKIRRALDIISTLLLSHKWTEGPVYVSAQSPVRLTQAGKQMLIDSQFEDFYIINKKMFFDYIAAQKPKTKSEVESAARSLMLYLDQAKTPNIELVEKFSYNEGKSIPSILYAYSIEIRDRYLKEKFIATQE